MIIDDCKMIGISLPPLNDDDGLPRFSLPLNKINYGALISRALYYFKKESRERAK